MRRRKEERLIDLEQVESWISAALVRSVAQPWVRRKRELWGIFVEIERKDSLT